MLAAELEAAELAADDIADEAAELAADDIADEAAELAAEVADEAADVAAEVAASEVGAAADVVAPPEPLLLHAERIGSALALRMPAPSNRSVARRESPALGSPSSNSEPVTS
jgi:hypothetical protein